MAQPFPIHLLVILTAAFLYSSSIVARPRPKAISALPKSDPIALALSSDGYVKDDNRKDDYDSKQNDNEKNGTQIGDRDDQVNGNNETSIEASSSGPPEGTANSPPTPLSQGGISAQNIANALRPG